MSCQGTKHIKLKKILTSNIAVNYPDVRFMQVFDLIMLASKVTL